MAKATHLSLASLLAARQQKVMALMKGKYPLIFSLHFVSLKQVVFPDSSEVVNVNNCLFGVKPMENKIQKDINLS